MELAIARNVDGLRMMPRDRLSRAIFSDVETFRLFALGLSSLREDASRTTVYNGDPSTSAFASSFLARSQRDPIYRSCKRSLLRPRRPDFHRIPVHPLLAQSHAARVPVHLVRDQAARIVKSRQFSWHDCRISRVLRSTSEKMSNASFDPSLFD